MALETNNPGRLEAEAYKASPATVDSPTSTHHLYEKGVRAETLISQQAIVDDVTNNVKPFLPTTDQKAALDGAATPTALNVFATMEDLSTLSTTQSTFLWKTAVDAPADGEAKMDNADPSLASVINLSNFNDQGLNISNITLLLGDGDAMMISDKNEGDKVYNFNVTGTPTQTGGPGTGGYVSVPVTFFAQGTGGLISDDETVSALLRYDGSSSLFLAKASNLSDLNNAATARTNLDVYAKADVYTKTEADNKYLAAASNLGDLASIATSRGNLDVYSKSEVEALASANDAAVGLNTTHRTSSGVDHTYLNQDVRTTASPSFVAVNGRTIATDGSKLDGIAAGATANSSDATLLARANHTGTQLAATISDFQTTVSANSNVSANTAKVTNATHTGDVTGSGALTIGTAIVTNAKLANMAQATIKGRASGAGTGVPVDLTAAQVNAILGLNQSVATTATPNFVGVLFHGDTAAANTLDDYEEGTWTPTFSNIGTGTYAVQIGRYTKIGDLVYVFCHIDVLVAGTASGQVIVAGLPFALGASQQAVTSSVIGVGWSVTSVDNTGFAQSSGSTIVFTHDNCGVSNNTTHADLGTGSLLFTMSYKA
jgi:hypothetical protein